MRSADRRLRPRHAGRLGAWACAAMLVLASGCATKKLPAPADHAAAATAKPGTKIRAESTEGAVSVSVQRAYDAALDDLNAGRREQAQRGLQELTQSEPQLGGPHANLGMIYRQAGKLPEAVAELEQAVRLNAQQPVYWNQLGITYRQTGDFAKAKEAYEKAIALDPSYAMPYLNLGILFDLYFWDSKRALELYDQFLKLSPGGDERVTKWIADLKNRAPKGDTVSRKEQER